MSKGVKEDKFELITIPNTSHFLTFTYLDETLFETKEIIGTDDESWIYSASNSDKSADDKTEYVFKPHNNEIQKELYKSFNIKKLIGKNKYGSFYELK